MGSTTDVLAAISAEPLDHSSATPLYRQLKHRFLQLIATGTLDENTPLPTEHALCAAFGLSRSTVRHCLKGAAASSRYLRLRKVAANGATARSLEVEEGEPL